MGQLPAAQRVEAGASARPCLAWAARVGSYRVWLVRPRRYPFGLPGDQIQPPRLDQRLAHLEGGLQLEEPHQRPLHLAVAEAFGGVDSLPGEGSMLVEYVQVAMSKGWALCPKAETENHVGGKLEDTRVETDEDVRRPPLNGTAFGARQKRAPDGNSRPAGG